MSTNSSRFKAVLFDLDGTLVEFKFPIKESRVAMFNFLKRNGYRTDHLGDNIRTQELIDDVEAQWSASEKMRELHTFEDLRHNLFRILDDFEYDSLSASKPQPGCLEEIQKINEEGLMTGIVTNSGRGPVISILAKYGFLPYMEVVVTRNEVPRMKPTPDGLLEAKRLLELQSEDILYVGDSVLDIEASRKAGMKCASIASGLYTASSLKKLSPDYLLKTIQDLESIIIPYQS